MSEPALQRSGAITAKDDNGNVVVLYEPQDHPRCNQVAYHASNAPNLLGLGTRATGKSLSLRWDAIIRCLIFPNFRALIIRRKMPDLRKSHLQDIGAEMKALGGVYLETTFLAKFPNGSIIQFSHCEKMKDVLDYLSSQWGFIGFDELSTFPLEMFLTISAAARTKVESGYKAVVRACSNTLGIGSAWMKQWFIDKTVDRGEYPDYFPDDFEVQYSWLDGNKHLDQKEYLKRLRNLPDHIRRSWLKMEFVTEGAYFTDFRKTEEIDGREVPWHCIHAMPMWTSKQTGEECRITDLPWMNIYRSIDWGYHPDPAVCHWHVVLPDKRKITFKELTKKRMVAADFAELVKKESEGMKIVETYCDPTMFIKTGETRYSIGEIMENCGIPLTPSQNDRELFGYSLNEAMNTLIDGRPSWQILEQRCPELVRTIPLLQMDDKNPAEVADGPDHWAISCAYFCMGGAPPSQDPVVSTIPRWMLPKHLARRP